MQNSISDTCITYVTLTCCVGSLEWKIWLEREREREREKERDKNRDIESGNPSPYSRLELLLSGLGRG